MPSFRERYIAVGTYLSSRAFPSKLLNLPLSGEGKVNPQEDIGERGIMTNTEEESHPVLLPALDLFNRESSSLIFLMMLQADHNRLKRSANSLALITPRIKVITVINHYTIHSFNLTRFNPDTGARNPDLQQLQPQIQRRTTPFLWFRHAR
jgi:hypothetical protein